MLVAQSCWTLCDPMDCSPPVSFVHEIFQARILEWVAISFSRGSSQLRNRTQVFCTAGRFFTNWATVCIEKEKKYRQFVSSCRLREIKVSGTCSVYPPFGDPWPSCLLPSQGLTRLRDWACTHVHTCTHLWYISVVFFQVYKHETMSCTWPLAF